MWENERAVRAEGEKEGKPQPTFKQVIHALRVVNDAVVIKDLRGVPFDEGGRSHTILPLRCHDHV